MPAIAQDLQNFMKDLSINNNSAQLSDKEDFFGNLLSIKKDKHKTNDLIRQIFHSPSRPGSRRDNGSQGFQSTSQTTKHEESIDGIQCFDGAETKNRFEEEQGQEQEQEQGEEAGEEAGAEEEEESDDDILIEDDYEVDDSELGDFHSELEPSCSDLNPQVTWNQVRASFVDKSNRELPIKRNPHSGASTAAAPLSGKISRASSVIFSRSVAGDELDSATSTFAAGLCFKSYHHATWYVSNAKQTAQYFIVTFGFKKIAYKGLETGCKGFAGHVVQNGDVIFEFVSPICSDSSSLMQQKGGWILEEMQHFITKHGDGVKDVSFEVTDVDLVFKHAIKAGAKSICEPRVISDEFGSIKKATIQVFEDMFHTLIEYQDYKGVYLPNYRAVQNNGFTDDIHGSALSLLPPVKLGVVDHCVQNKDWNKMNEGCDVYSKVFGFHQFWSVDEKDVSTEFSALRSMVMASSNDVIKMPINEPAEGLCRSQVEEFLDFHDGPGVQHIAVTTSNIIETVRNMKARGAEFITVPELYYENLLPRLLATGVPIEEDLKKLKELDILIDFDEKGYLLQIFTKPLTDRPTFFLEIIQRHNHNGFGVGNFKALFQTIEQEQRLRGTLEKDNGKNKIAGRSETKDIIWEI